MSHLYTAKEQFLQLTSEGFICNKLPVYKDTQKTPFPHTFLCVPHVFCLPSQNVGLPISSRAGFLHCLISHPGSEALSGPPFSYLFFQQEFFLIFCQDVQLTFLCS